MFQMDAIGGNTVVDTSKMYLRNGFYHYYVYPTPQPFYTFTWVTYLTLNFEDKGDYFEGLLELPGYDKSSIKIEVEDSDVKVSAHRERDKKDFSVTTTLPKNSGELSAKFDNGELVIRVEKVNKKKLVKIE